MAISYQTGISILQLVFFVPGLAAAVWLCWRQGLKAVAASWRFIIVLALLRIIGAVCQIVSVTHLSEDIIIVIIICNLLGLAPLTLTCVGLLGRVNQSMKQLHEKYFAAISLISLAGLGVGIAGAVKAVNTAGSKTSYSINSLIIAALSLFIVCFAMMLFALGYLLFQAYQDAGALTSEKRTLIGVAACAPFLLVRLVYAAIADFGKNRRFSQFGGDDTIALCMGVLEEIIVMIICLLVGFLVPPPPETQQKEKPQDSAAVSAVSNSTAEA